MFIQFKVITIIKTCYEPHGLLDILSKGLVLHEWWLPQMWRTKTHETAQKTVIKSTQCPNNGNPVTQYSLLGNNIKPKICRCSTLVSVMLNLLTKIWHMTNVIFAIFIVRQIFEKSIHIVATYISVFWIINTYLLLSTGLLLRIQMVFKK